MGRISAPQGAEEHMKEVNVLSLTPEIQIELSGTIDSGNAEEFGAEVLAAYDSAKGDICFLCDKLEFIDSTTLGTFVKILKHVKTDGHKMTLKGLNAHIKKLFVICALDTIMEIQ